MTQPGISIFNPYASRRVFMGVPDNTEIILEPMRWTGPLEPTAALANAVKQSDFLIDYGATSKAYQPLPGLIVAGPIDGLTGYGILFERFCHYLDAKLHLRLFELAHWHEHQDISPRVVELMRESKSGIEPHEWALCFSLPTELCRVPARRRILYSMFETNRLPGTELPAGNPDRWADITNTWAEAVIVPCESQKEMWQKSGVTVPIYTCPLGVDTEVFTYYERPVRKEDEPFTILLYGMLTGRKSPVETLVDVCWRAFGPQDNWHLILKTWGGFLGAGAYGSKFINDPHVEVIDQQWHRAQIAGLCRGADIGVFLSRYEGWGLPPREMMATGLPVIWTAHSGHLPDVNANLNIPIGFTEVLPIEDESYRGLGGWYEPDYAQAAEALRREYHDWQERGRTQSEMGKRAAEYIAKYRSWEYCTGELLKVVQEITGLRI